MWAGNFTCLIHLASSTATREFSTRLNKNNLIRFISFISLCDSTGEIYYGDISYLAARAMELGRGYRPNHTPLQIVSQQ